MNETSLTNYKDPYRHQKINSFDLINVPMVCESIQK